MKKHFCPKCKSENIEINPTALESATGLNPNLKCLDCDFQAPAFPVKKTNIKENKRAKK
jgi:hypothetical protein